MEYAMWFVLLVNIYTKTQADIFAATAEVEYLVRTRQRLINDLHLYITEEEKKLFTLKRYYELIKTENEKAIKNVSSYINNPLNAFIIIKSLTVDFDHVKKLIQRGTEYAQKLTMKQKNFVYPTLEDLTGTVQGLSRLINMCHLDVMELSKGNLPNKHSVSRSPMSADDCYVLGRTLYKEKDFKIAILWMKEAFRKYKAENITYEFTDVNILEYISYGYYKIGDKERGLQWIQKILNVNPNHQKATRLMTRYKRRINRKSLNTYSENQNLDTVYLTLKEDKKEADLFSIFMENYEELCRGDVDVPIELSSRLTCRYLDNRHPFLKIAPVKMEMKYLNPDVVLFYDVVSDLEIEMLKRMAMPDFQRATVTKSKTGVVDDFRISKATWLLDNQFDKLQRISRRLALITGLSMEHSQPTQVCNYGIGGHCLPHFDPHKVNNDTYRSIGRRIATILLYLSDVAQGGATVFTRLGVRVVPVKGAAIFWFNLHASGEVNQATLHAACPVLEGSKWVCNKWIYQAGQELRKPCDLQYQPEGYNMTAIPGPVLKTFRYF